MVNRLSEYEQSSTAPLVWQRTEDMHEPSWQDRLSQMTSIATRWVREHPEIALTAAVVTGVVLGWFIKRR
jgi:ElaB/YqjD/DUF883 family membrane-anchored ribosome-binding protein